MRLVRKDGLRERLEPAAIGTGGVTAPGFQGGFQACDLRVVEIELLGRDSEGGIPDHSLLASDRVVLEFDGLLFVGRERDLVLEGPDGADRGRLDLRGAEAEWRLQGLE